MEDTQNDKYIPAKESIRGLPQAVKLKNEFSLHMFPN